MVPSLMAGNGPSCSTVRVVTSPSYFPLFATRVKGPSFPSATTILDSVLSPSTSICSQVWVPERFPSNDKVLSLFQAWFLEGGADATAGIHRGYGGNGGDGFCPADLGRDERSV